MFLGVTLCLVSIFMVAALFSHFNHSEHDQSAVINLGLEEIAKTPGIVDNVGGGFGAWLSEVLLCDTLGLGSIVVIAYMWILALALFGARKCSFWGTTFRCLLLSITISIVLGLVTYHLDTVVYWGGNHGHYVNQYLIANSTYLGAMLVSILLVTAVCCVYLNELRIVWNKWRAAVRRRRLQEELRRERQRELDRLEDEAREEERRNAAAKAGETPGLALDDVEDKPQQPQAASIAPESDEDTAAQGHKSFKEKLMGLKEKLSLPHSQEKSRNESAVADGTHADENPETAASGSDLTVDASGASGTATPAQESDDDLLIIDKVQQASVADTIQADDTFSVVAPEIETADEDQISRQDILTPYDHRAELSRYSYPPLSLLEDRPSGPNIDMAEQQANKERIEKTLLDYKISISRIEATVGPTVTLYEIVPAEGVRISQIKRLEDDIALSLSALGIRIIAPIPGKGTVGIEVPNNDPQTVSMRSVIASKKYQECKMALPMAMGATISNDIFIADLAKMPHLLVAGATGMGKSVGLNAIIASLLYKKHPSELKFVLIDPKMVEFSLYSKLERHYLAKLQGDDDAIITDMNKVIQTLNSLCVEMDNRYELLRDANVRSLEEYNKKFTDRRLNPEKGHKYLPYIVVVVDEFADLIMTQGKEVETPIARIAQKARAVGIHMILATQRPSTNVITGLIKANFPGRIAFRVIQMVDSRTILDCPGANQLIGRGDMLFSHNGNMTRVQCAFISTEEVEALTQFVDDQIGYEHAYYLPEYVSEEAEGGVIAGASTERDAIFDEAARFVVSRQMGSTSSLQRQFGIGYNRAGKLMDQMEAAGIVGPVNGSKPRNILVDMMSLETILGN